MLQRYEWEDALVHAQSAGLISNGDLLVCLKLAAEITWNPKKNLPPGLYYANDDAFELAGVGRATFYKKRKSLLETGFFQVVNGNLLPTLPDESLLETIVSHRKQAEEKQRVRREGKKQSKESHLETLESPTETKESLVETGKSLGDNTLSVDTYTVDTSSEDSLSVQAAPAVDSDSSTSPLSSLSEDSASPLVKKVPSSALKEKMEQGRQVQEEVRRELDAAEVPEAAWLLYKHDVWHRRTPRDLRETPLERARSAAFCSDNAEEILRRLESNDPSQDTREPVEAGRLNPGASYEASETTDEDVEVEW